MRADGSMSSRRRIRPIEVSEKAIGKKITLPQPPPGANVSSLVDPSHRFREVK